MMRACLFAFALSLASFGLSDKIDDLAKAEMAALHCPGMTITVVRDGKIIKQGAYGKANLELDAPVKNETVFEIGSVSKQFTAAAILQLVDAGKLGLDDTVGKWLPDAPDEWKPITVRQLLSHTSGIREYLQVTLDMRKDYSLDALLKEIAKKPCDYAPGLCWSYSNGGYAVAGAILEKAGGETWEKQITNRIFVKLGMGKTTIQSLPTVVPNRAAGYTWNGKAHSNGEVLRKGVGTTAGSILSTGEDLAKWAIALDQGKVTSPSVMNIAFQPIKLSSGRSFDYGLGWFIDTSGPDRIVEHGGNTFGQSAHIFRVPSKRFTVIVLSNIAMASFAGLSRQIRDTYWTPAALPALPEAKVDPDSGRGDLVLQAIKSMGAGKLPPELFDEEMIALFKTTRGLQALAGAKAQFSKAIGLRYIKERQVEMDTEVLYQVYTKEDSSLLRVRITTAGKVVRIAGGRW